MRLTDGPEREDSNPSSLTGNPRLATVHHLVREGRTSPVTGPMTFVSPSNQVYGTQLANA